MVWFQCEDCGDNLKKPKLPNHFRQCSAYKLSCIDCGQVFGQQDVEGHTQCITEAEKYGPKGQTKAANGTNTKPKNDGKQRPEVDINVGLSDRPPWFCSLCNTKATSKQTLLLHADGKKHRAKARAFHASKQPPNNGSAETNGSNENKTTNEIPENKVAPQLDGPEVENDALAPSKKRKADASENVGAHPKTGGEISAEIGNGEVVQIKGSETEVKKVKKAKQGETEKDAETDSTTDKGIIGKKKTKWKKLITSALESNQDGVVKFKKLRKEVMKSLKEAGHHTEEKDQVSEILEHNINSSSRFVVDGKYVRLAKLSVAKIG